ncbi:hypothetical protein V8G54_009763, partial [Vigna mungo]
IFCHGNPDFAALGLSGGTNKCSAAELFHRRSFVNPCNYYYYNNHVTASRSSRKSFTDPTRANGLLPLLPYPWLRSPLPPRSRDLAVTIRGWPGATAWRRLRFSAGASRLIRP